jgi:tRNA-dihydrouridine synthase
MSFLENLPNPFLVLAPMDDVTDTVFRQVVASLAKPDLFFTEFVNVDGLQSPGRPRLMHKLKLSNHEHPIIAQLWGLNPENYYKTTKEIIEMGYDGVDINMGCPVKTVVKNGACAALINNKELAGQIIDATKAAAANKIPVSVKTRVGFNEADHAHGLMLANKYGLDGVMLGRGIFDDPFAFAPESPWPSYTKQQKIDLYRHHAELFVQTWQNNERKIETLNKFCKVYISGFEGAKELRDKLMRARNAEELYDLLS